MIEKMAKYFWIMLMLLWQIAVAGPPEPPVPAISPPPAESIGKPDTKAAPTLTEMTKKQTDSLLKENDKITSLKSAQKLAELSEQHAESLLKEAEKIQSIANSNREKDNDSIKEDLDRKFDKARRTFGQAMGLLDTSALASFKEIIIDENGVIKARTDSGLITLDKSRLDSLLPEEIPDFDSSSRRQLTRWGENVIVDEDTHINSDIQVIRANVTVKGVVNGDVTTMGGDIYVTSTGVINGNAMAIGGKIKKDDGARITGASMQMKLPLMNTSRGSTFQLILGISLLVVLLGLLFAWLMVALVPVPMNRITQELLRNPFKSFLFGYVLYLGLPIAWVLLLVTILGIPIALLVIPLAFPLAIVQAYATINIAVGQRLFKKTNTLQAFMFGIMTTTTIPLLLLIIGYAAGSLPFFVFNMIFLGFFFFLFVPFGLGAALNTRFGFYRKDKKPEKAPTQVNI